MPERGGTTTQSGIYYQNTVAALFLGDLCDASSSPDPERVTEVRVEAREAVDDIVVAYADTHRLFIQAKEKLTKGDSAWIDVWRDLEHQFFAHDFRLSDSSDQLLLHIGEWRSEHSDLRELCNRAGGHTSYEEWWQSLNRNHQALVRSIRSLLGPEHSSDDSIHSFLAHLAVEIVSLRDLESYDARRRMPESNVEPAHLLRLLRDRVGGRARYRKAFHAAELRRSLEQENQVILAIPLDLDVLKNSFKTCGALLRQHENSVQGIHVDRSETTAVAEWVQAAGSRVQLGVLLDRAGSGKSAVMRDVMEQLETAGVAALGIKADRQLTGVDSDEALQERLHLPEPVLRALMRLAEVARVVVLIDQVDALSLSLSRDQRTLDYVLDLVARIRSIPNVRIVLSCRTFDYRTTPGLRQVTADQEWQLGDLAEEAVVAVVRDLGGNPDDLLTSERELLHTGLNPV